METVFIILTIITLIVSIPLALYLAIMGNNKGGIISLLGIFLGTLIVVSLIPIAIIYFALSVCDWVIDYCKESNQTVLVSGIGILLILKGIFKSEFNNKYSKLLTKLFYLIIGSILIWYGINFGYGNLNWNSILIFSIVSGIIECIAGYIDWRRKNSINNSIKNLFNKNKPRENNDHLPNLSDDEIKNSLLNEIKNSGKNYIVKEFKYDFVGGNSNEEETIKIYLNDKGELRGFFPDTSQDFNLDRLSWEIRINIYLGKLVD